MVGRFCPPLGQAGVDLKPPSGFQQLTPPDELLEIDSRNASGLKVSWAQQPSLFCEFQQRVYVVFWHAFMAVLPRDRRISLPPTRIRAK